MFDGSPEKKSKPRVSLSMSGSDRNDYEFKPPGNEPSSSSDDDDDVASDDEPFLMPPNHPNEPRAHPPGPAIPSSSNLAVIPRMPHPSAVDQRLAPTLASASAMPPGPPPKVKKPRKPKVPKAAPVPPPQIASSSGVPSTSAADLHIFPIENARMMTGPYKCPMCGQRHGTGGCEMSGSIDSLLDYWNKIMGPDNMDTHHDKVSLLFIAFF